MFVLFWVSVAALFLASSRKAAAQEMPPPASTSAAQQTPTGASQILRLTLDDALARARKNSTQFLAAQTDAAIARQDRYQAGAALLPNVTYDNQAISTSVSKGTLSFIANNGPHEYLSQANVHESIDLVSISAFKRASAASALAKARAEIASRGLVVTVVQGYYAVAAAQLKLEAAKKNGDEGDRFLKLTQDLEKGGEVAHSDVIKAELQMQDRRRQLLEAQLGLLNARLDFAVLIFPDFNDNFELAEELHASVALPTLAEVQQRAARDNPDLRAALAAVQQAGHDVTGARGGYLPSLSFDYWYGIDAAQFAVNGLNGASNLGSAAAATLN
ncbi:MAG: TolC family protein, partial [Acidobacteria bacterium]